MARAADIRGAAHLVPRVVFLTVAGGYVVAEFVIQALGGKITFLLGDPLVKPQGEGR
jgi:hypothetical protein